MKAIVRRKYWIILAIIVIGILSYSYIFTRPAIDFNTQIKPIFNKKCIVCHGGVKQKSGFSLLFRADALGKTESGKPAILPGDPDHSEMIKRLTNKDPEERMPYKEEPLSEDEINILKQWIKEGAVWGNHWAYVPVKEVPVPKPKGALWGLLPARKNDWIKNDIDYFIYEKLKEQKLEPSKEADKITLLRRLSIDLIGLPAPAKLASQYLADTTDKAYENLVDSLLLLPQYGERWTSMWLDLARYADTKGYEKDGNRSMWRYRDWLIKAFNDDRPYDEFLVEQIAGDLIPGASDEQYIATAFHRNTMTNDEGGIDNEEFRTAAVIDRTNTTWEALMGTTFGCVQCHSHPYDPFKNKEYYKFLAFFNNSRDENTYFEYPLLHEYKKEDSLKFLKLQSWLSENAGEKEKKEIIHFLKTWQPAINSIHADSFTNSDVFDSKYLLMRKNSAARLKHIDLTGKTKLISRFTSWLKGGELTIRVDSAKGRVIATSKIPRVKDAWKFLELELPEIDGIHDLHFEYQNERLKNEKDNGMVFDWFSFIIPFPGKNKPGYDTASKYFHDLLYSTKVEVTPIMMENQDLMFRTTRVFERGNWLAKRDTVQPDVPHSMNPMPKGAPRNRMGLAMWLVAKENPLTARTMVNRLWEQIFGQGIVESLEDMGTQCIPPTHPELLNYLSYKFMYDYKWGVKKLLKEIVMSASYRQDSKVSPEALQKDQFNKFYSRASRIRLSAEQVRDQALFVSGILSKKMYGPSVMPYQPDGIWQSPYSNYYWVKSTGEDQHRRGVYTFWKRTAPYPSMFTFDGVTREVCTARRIRTNTPLQALTTMNDPAYIDAARHFAYRLQREAGPDLKTMIKRGYILAMGDTIHSDKLSALENLYYQALPGFVADKEKTCGMIGVMNEHNNPETAALVVVTNAILNLDEFVTKN